MRIINRLTLFIVSKYSRSLSSSGRVDFSKKKKQFCRWWTNLYCCIGNGFRVFCICSKMFRYSFRGVWKMGDKISHQNGSYRIFYRRTWWTLIQIHTCAQNEASQHIFVVKTRLKTRTVRVIFRFNRLKTGFFFPFFLQISNEILIGFGVDSSFSFFYFKKFQILDTFYWSKEPDKPFPFYGKNNNVPKARRKIWRKKINRWKNGSVLKYAEYVDH